jgi:rhamnopyranosyl-N-acetylglucosaminyl-diphospho-decaprenol beta-1,3/1,4-galactofuranosyltransferase
MPAIPLPPANFRVAAVFVTMNRSATALTCLARLATQTRRPDEVHVLDNASTDGTAEKLSAFGASRSGLDLKVRRLPENLGNAGGMEIGMDAAFAAGFDAVWILDDDSWPEPDALENLLAPELPADAVRSSRVIDPLTGSLSWPLQIHMGSGWRLLEGDDSLADEQVIPIRRSWLGALIPRVVYEAVGPVEGRLFLRGEDEDYPRRIERAGFPVFMIRNSVLHHPSAGPLNRWHIFGREVVLERNLQGDKLYYRLRNSWWMARREYGSTAAVADAILCFFALTCWKAPSMRWIPVWFQAFRDAHSDRLGIRRSSKQIEGESPSP